MIKKTSFTIILGTLSFLFSTCMNGRGQRSNPSASDIDKSKAIFIQVSVLWEGVEIQDFNLKALKSLKSQFPLLSFKHFISPAYYTREGANGDEISKRIKSVMAENDSAGLYLQPWKSLAKTVGVEFRPHLTFWGEAFDAKACELDCGGDMPLNTYSEADLDKFVSGGLKILADSGFKTVDGFFAAGWLTTPATYNVLANHNLDDYSQVPPSVLFKRLRPFPLYGWLLEGSADISPLSLPNTIKTRNGSVVGFGNSAGIVDYQTSEDTVRLFDDFIAQRKSASVNKPLIFHIGIHQESANQYAHRLKAIIQSVFAKSAAASVELAPLDPAVFRSQDVLSPL
jgi:hypothetical protein